MLALVNMMGIQDVVQAMSGFPDIMVGFMVECSEQEAAVQNLWVTGRPTLSLKPASAWTVWVTATPAGARKVTGYCNRPASGVEGGQLLAQVGAVAIRALRRGRRLAYQLLEFLAASGACVFVDGHDVDPVNYPVV